MTRQEAKKLVLQLVTDFSADDVKIWLSEACQHYADGLGAGGCDWEAGEWQALADHLANVPNLGI